jgi:hypothetical protein
METSSMSKTQKVTSFVDMGLGKQWVLGSGGGRVSFLGRQRPWRKKKGHRKWGAIQSSILVGFWWGKGRWPEHGPDWYASLLFTADLLGQSCVSWILKPWSDSVFWTWWFISYFHKTYRLLNSAPRVEVACQLGVTVNYNPTLVLLIIHLQCALWIWKIKKCYNTTPHS